MTGNGGKLYHLFEIADDWGMAQMTLFYPHKLCTSASSVGLSKTLGNKSQHSPGPKNMWLMKPCFPEDGHFNPRNSIT